MSIFNFHVIIFAIISLSVVQMDPIGKPPMSFNSNVKEPSNRAEAILPQRNNVAEPSAVQYQMLHGKIPVADYDNAELDDSDDQETQADEEQDPDLSFHKRIGSQTLTRFEEPDFDLSAHIFEEKPTYETFNNLESIRSRNDYGKIVSNPNYPKTRNFAVETYQNNFDLNGLKADSKDQTSLEYARRKFSAPQSSSYNNNIAGYHGLDQKLRKSLKQNSESMQHRLNSNKKIYKNPNKYRPVSQSSSVNSDVDNFFRSLSRNADDYEVEEDEEPSTNSLFSEKDLKVKREEDSSPKQKIAQVLDRELNKILESNGSNPCSDCKDLQAKNEKLRAEIKMEQLEPGELMPAYACDDWFLNNRTCWLNRNVGNTVTFNLRLGEGDSKKVPIQWRKEFHVLNSKKRKIFPIDSGKVPWNMVIANLGHEFRLIPVTESDIDSNSFSAVVISLATMSASSKTHHKVNFRIRVHPIDQGFLYPGEPVTLNVRRTVTLPQEAVRFRWYRESDESYEPSSSLPSNMQKKGKAGETLVMSELRPRDSGVIACAVFTNLGVFATKQRFLINVSGSDPNRFASSPISAHRKRKRGIEENGLEYMERMASQVRPYGENYEGNVRQEDYGSNVYEAPAVLEEQKPISSYQNAPYQSQESADNDRQANYLWGLKQNEAAWPNNNYGSNEQPPAVLEEQKPISSYQNVPYQSQESADNDQRSNPGYKIEELFPGYNLPQYIPKPSHDIFTSGSNVGKSTLITNSDTLNTKHRQSSIANKNTVNSNSRISPKVVEVIRTKERIHPKVKTFSQIKENSKIGTNSDQSRNRNNQNIQIAKTDLTKNLYIPPKLTKNLYIPPKDLNKKTVVQEYKKIDSNLSNMKKSAGELSRLRDDQLKTRVNIPENKRLFYPNHSNKKVTTDNRRVNPGMNMNIAIGSKTSHANVGETRPTDRQQSMERLTGRINNGRILNLNKNQETGPTNRHQQASVNSQINNGRTRLLNSNLDKVKETRLETEVSGSSVEDLISKFIASCTSNLHCAPAAYCIKGSGFCRCKDGYRGNGFFCWGLN